ncbi:MAG: hypothetical protein AB7O97_12995 [Planctomycetota bacterium]
MVDSRTWFSRRRDAAWAVLVAASGTLHAQGETWSELATSPRISPAASLQQTIQAPAELYFDTLRRRLCLFSGLDASHWELDGGAWRRLLPNGLGPVEGRGIVTFVGFDALAQQLVVATEPDTSFRDLPTEGLRRPGGWAFQRRGGWLSGSGSAVDPVNGRLFVFGGFDTAQNLRDLTAHWDGGWSVQATPAGAPSPRAFAAMATDRARGRVVLFGGQDANGALGDTWEWNGAVWTAVSTAGGPLPRRTELCFDPVLGRVVQLGEFEPSATSRQAWSWDGAVWSPIAQLPGQVIVTSCDDGAAMFAMTSDDGNGLDTWRRDAAGWTLVVPAGGMPSRTGEALAADATNGGVVCFGGADAGGDLGDTWVWDDGWQLRATAGPSPRRSAALAPNSPGGSVLLFGGRDAAGLLGDTWSWNGTAWSPRSPIASPAPRAGHAMAADAAGGRAWMFGGELASGLTDELWEYDGVTWRQPVIGGTRPGARLQPLLVYDPLRQVLVMASGGDASGFSSNETWEHAAGAWSLRSQAAFVVQGDFDADRGAVVAYGVASAARGMLRWDGSTWSALPEGDATRALFRPAHFESQRRRLLQFDPQSGLERAFTPTGAAADSALWMCGPVTPQLEAVGRPRPGASLLLDLFGVPGAAAFVGFGERLDPSPLVSGCFLEVTRLALVEFGLVDALGRLRLGYSIPPVPAMRGLETTAQALVVDGGPVGGGSLSNRRTIRIGD